MKVGIMDSGIGGLTTLSRLMKFCGGQYIYLSDSTSYGDKPDEFVLSRSLLAAEKLASLGAEIIVLACNTATNVAIGKLRETLTSVRFIGTEPAVRPALRSCASVAVALTPTAARQPKFLRLIEADRARIKLITPDFLAPAIEKSFFDKTEMEKLAKWLLGESKGCDGLVLGCTHYIFLRPMLSGIKVFDGNEGVARRLYDFTGNMGAASVSFERMGI